MAEVTPEMKQARAKEFLSLLPLSTTLAGLADCPPDRAFTADQMEARATQLRIAFKQAKALVKEIADAP